MRTRSGRSTKAKTEKTPPYPLRSPAKPKARPITEPYEKQLKEKDKIISKLTKELNEALEGVESLHNKIEDFLSCAICHEMFQKPYMLPTCGHTFCSECIVSWRLARDKNSGIQHPVAQSLGRPFNVPCPMCRKNETCQLRRNRLVESLVCAYIKDVHM